MLIRRHQEVAFRAAYAVCGDAAEAEDAAQEAFIKAHAALWRFRTGAPFRPWLLRIAANEARNRRRSAGRREHLALLVGRSLVLRATRTTRRRQLAAALDRLDAPHREVVLLRHVLELSEAETRRCCAAGRARSSHGCRAASRRLREELA